MKKPKSKTTDELRPEYDLRQLLKGAVRGKYAKQFHVGTNFPTEKTTMSAKQTNKTSKLGESRTGQSDLFDVSPDHAAGTSPQEHLRANASMGRIALVLVKAYPKFVPMEELAKQFAGRKKSGVSFVDERCKHFNLQWPLTFKAEFSADGKKSGGGERNFIRVKLLRRGAYLGNPADLNWEAHQLTLEPVRTPGKPVGQLGSRRATKRPENEGDEQGTRAPLSEDGYLRASRAQQKIILPRHKELSNDFCNWLESQYGVAPVQERQRVDIRFSFKKQRIMAELKICYGLGTTKSIREALGQLLEYNHYPQRIASDKWLMILDDEPTVEDRQFIELLRRNVLLPLHIGWRNKHGFSFHPRWPQESN